MCVEVARGSKKFYNFKINFNKEIFEKGALEIDTEKRKAIYDRYQEIIYEEKPIIYLYSPLQITAIRKKFGNIFPTPLGGTTHNLEEIYIK